MDLDVYTSEVKTWAAKLRDRIKAEAQSQTKSNPNEKRNRPYRTRPLASAFTSRVRNRNGAPDEVKIEWKEAIHAVFVEYGVGRGYIRVNGKVIRGSRTDKKRNFKIGSGSIRRNPKPIITDPMEKSIDELSAIAQKAAERRIVNAMEIKI